MHHPDAAAARHILVVDDDDAVREAIGLSLEGAGYDVGYAQDGRSALAAVDRRQPEAIVTDLQMPGMDGLELLRQMAVRNRGVPVIAMSGGGETMLESARRLGAVAAFAKPVRVETLTSALARCKRAA